jgi:hypothetical protein
MSDWDYYAERLDDPDLLTRAVVAETGRLCVPVGGRRVAGETACEDAAQAERIAAVLRDRPGFPDVRWFPPPPDDGTIWNPAATVCWGEETEDVHGLEALGRAYGYSDRAIAACKGRMRRLLAGG